MPLDLQALGPDFIKAFRAGEEHAFDRVFRLYFGPLTFYAVQYVKEEAIAEDIVQDCFVELWERRRKLERVESINSYLYRCVHNRSLLFLEKQKKKPLLTIAEELESVETAIVKAEILAGMLKVMNQLPARMQQVLQMYYLEEKSCTEIGNEIGIDPETVRSHRYRAIQLLRKTIITG